MTEEQKSKRIHAIVYSCDSREELAERMVKLEGLVSEMISSFCTHECCCDMFCKHEWKDTDMCDPDNGVCWFKTEAGKLGIESGCHE